MIYRHFATVYDAFMGIVPYEEWAGYIDKALRGNGVPTGATVLDLACGTGTMAALMAQKGYEIIGVDASADMLSEAYRKCSEIGIGNDINRDISRAILFLNQDMRDLDLYGTVSAAYATCDAMNYLLTDEDFIIVLKKVAMFLEPDGVFVFDLKTDYKYRELGENTYQDDNARASYIWKNHYDPKTCINAYNVRFFVEGGGTFEEVHRQRAYSTEAVTAMANEAGLRVVLIEDNYTEEPPNSDSTRLTYTCKALSPNPRR